MARNLAILTLAVAMAVAFGIGQPSIAEGENEMAGTDEMRLGAFSVSLAVKDLEASRAFYAKLGFEPIGGDAAQNWLILRNGDAVIGLFQGMFEGNILTFNPGWTSREGEEHPESFTDVRRIQELLKERGLTLTTEADPASAGPASLTLVDPDGNAILLDQHR